MKKLFAIIFIMVFWLTAGFAQEPPEVKQWTGNVDLNELIGAGPVIMNKQILDIAASGDWTDLDAVEGGSGGIYTTWTDIDSATANATYSDWTTKLSLADGQSQNNAESYLCAIIYFNAGANDTLRAIIQARGSSDNLIVNADTLAVVNGATTPVAWPRLVTFSSYGQKYRMKLENVSLTGGTANAAGNDVQISFYWAKTDVINPVRRYNDIR